MCVERKPRKLSSFIISFLFVVPALAQQPVLSISALPADHHDVYNAYFNYHATWLKWSAKQTGVNTASLNQSATAFAKMIGVGAAEISIVHSASLNVTQRINALSAQKAASVGLSQHEVNQFEVRRQQIILSAVRDLQHRLKPESWGGFHQYVNNGFRLQGTAYPGLPIGTVLP